MITIQYLEPAPALASLSSAQVIEKLRRATENLPFSHLLLGWDLPERLAEACCLEAKRLGLRLLRWHPLLSSDGVFQAQPAWQVSGLSGTKVSGFQDMPEFTFVCPNHPQAREAIEQRLADLLRQGLYQGFFLDRVRFPSPAAAPLTDLGCFCQYCRAKAAQVGFDLEYTRRLTLQVTATPAGRLALVESMLGCDEPACDPLTLEAWQTWFHFRQLSVTELVQRVTRPLKAAGMEIGLDCFSPSLTRMVGQDLAALSRLDPPVDWIKVMTYAHTFGPAGLPYEYMGLLDFITGGIRLNEMQTLDRLRFASRLPLPGSRLVLARQGLSPATMAEEARSAQAKSAIPTLAGVELVEIEQVAQLNDAQITADLNALRAAKIAGLALSWDLWHMPLSRLSLVRRAWFDPPLAEPAGKVLSDQRTSEI